MTEKNREEENARSRRRHDPSFRRRVRLSFNGSQQRRRFSDLLLTELDGLLGFYDAYTSVFP